MANTKQVRHNLELLGMYFAEKGKVLTKKEYVDATDKPVLFSGIRKVFRSYSRMVLMLERNQPELFEFTNSEEVETPEPTKDPLESLKSTESPEGETNPQDSENEEV